MFVCILYIVVNWAFLLLSHNCSQPVSKYKDSFDAKIAKPVTILAAYSCTFSYLSVSKFEQPSFTTEAYLLIKVTYMFDNLFLHKVNFSSFSNPNFSLAWFTMLSMYIDHFKSSETRLPCKVWEPQFIWLRGYFFPENLGLSLVNITDFCLSRVLEIADTKMSPREKMSPTWVPQKTELHMGRNIVSLH